MKMITCAVLFLLSIATSACGATGESGDGDKTVNIAIQGLNLQTIYPMAAEELGYFDEAGVDVKVIVNKSSGAQAIQGMIGGTYQMFFGGADSLVAASLGEENLRIIAAGANSSIWNLIAESGTSSVEDLKGAKIAVLSDQGLLTQAIRYVLESNGLDDGDVTLVPAGNTPQRIAALSSGQVQAAAISVPQNFAATDDQGSVDLGDLGDLGAPALVTVALQVDDRWAAENRAEVAKVLEGYKALVNDLHSGANDAEIVPFFATKLGVEAQYIETAFQHTFREGPSGGKQLPADLAVDMEALKNTALAFRDFGAIKSDVDVEGLVDTSYLEEIQG